MLLHCLSGGQPGDYVEQAVLRLNHVTDAHRLVTCWNSTLNRYPLLRASFQWSPRGEPTQVAGPVVTLPLVEEDWRGHDSIDASASLSHFLEVDRATPFDVSQAPLSRLALFRTGEGAYFLVWTIHHLLVDGRSIALLLREIFDDFDGVVPMKGAVNDAKPDYAAYLKWLQQQRVPAQEAFWRQQLDGIRERAPFVLNTPPPAVPPLPGHGSVDGQLEPAVGEALQQFCDREQLTANIVLLGAWAVLLSQYAEQDEIVVGVTKSVRNCPAASDSSIGVYINTLPVRCSRANGADCVDWLRELRDQWISLRPFEHTSQKVIQACCGLDGNRSLYDAHYVFDRARLSDSLCAHDGRWRSREVQLIERTPLPLMLAAYGGVNVTLSIEYDIQRLGVVYVRRMLQHFVFVLRSILLNPSGDIGDIPRLSPDERTAQLSQWQTPGRPFSRQCLHHGFERAAAAYPGHIAMVFDHSAITYAECALRVCRMAHLLEDNEVKPGDRIGLFMRRSIDAIVTLLAVLKIGAVHVPIDPAYPAARIDHIIRDAELAALICSADETPIAVPEGTRVVQMQPQLHSTTLPDRQPVSFDDDSAVAYLIYTSGSSGMPKGVCVGHREAAGHIDNMRVFCAITPGDRVLQFASLSFDVSLEQIFTTLSVGATLILIDPTTCDPSTFSALIRREGITVADLPPAFLKYWVERGLPQGDPDFGAQFRLLLVGGDELALETVKRWQACPATRGVRLVNAYGPTETIMTATTFEVPPAFGQDAGTCVPIGRPLPGTLAYVVNSQMEALPFGFAGELALGGERMALGYYQRPELTGERFVPSPFCGVRGARLYRTGDLVRVNEAGQIAFLGRIDDQIKLRGFRIELGEIEAGLMRHDAVADAVVRKFTRPGGDAELAAYVVPVTRDADVGNLREWLRAFLPAHMIPAAFVTLEALPMAVSGKVDYQALPAPEGADYVSAGVARVAPESPTEKTIAALWHATLGVEGIGVHDNFFDSGGHSLLAMHLVSQVNAALESSVTLLQFFGQPTIAGLASASARPVSSGRPSEVSSGGRLVKLKTGTGVPFFCVKGAGDIGGSYETLVAALRDDQPFYGFPDVDFPEFETVAQVPAMEVLAARCLQSIREVRPMGPYYLGGYSFGGLVAYEIARQLLDAGERVPLIVIFDSYVPGFDQRFHREAFGRIGGLMHRVVVRLRMMARTWKLLLGYARDGVRIATRRAFSKLSCAGQPSVGEYLQWIWLDMSVQYYLIQAGLVRPSVAERRLDMLEDQLVRHSASRMESSKEILDAYTLRPIPATITLFRAEHDPWHMERFDPTFGWGAYAQNGVRVEVVAGNHMVIIRRPYATSLGRVLQRVIDAAGGSDKEADPER